MSHNSILNANLIIKFQDIRLPIMWCSLISEVFYLNVCVIVVLNANTVPALQLNNIHFLMLLLSPATLIGCLANLSHYCQDVQSSSERASVAIGFHSNQGKATPIESLLKAKLN